MRKLFLVLSIFIFGISFSQTGINLELKKELDAILKSDQIFREFSDSNTTAVRKAEILKETGYSKLELNRDLWQIVDKTDAKNIKRIEEIIAKFGYPGKKLVGEPTNLACWYVIQHSKEISKYFPLIQKAGAEGEISKTSVAMMQDRLLMYDEKEQIYGTQGAGRLIINSEGKEEFFNFIWPIQSPEKVNELRKKIGFTTTVEENAKNLGMEYKVFTILDYKSLKLR
jgi:hypothetical protein